MKNIIKIFLLTLIVFSFSNCVEETAIIKQEPTFFDLKDYFKNELSALSQRTKIYKATSVDGDRIEKELDSIDFSLELKVFEESDINKVAWIDKYLVDSVFSSTGDLTKIIYNAADEKLRTRQLLVSFDKNEVDTIEIFNNASSNVAKLEQHLTYIPAIGYSIESTQKTTFSEEHVLSVDVRFVK